MARSLSHRLIPHVTLAIVIVPMVIITLIRGLRARYDKHRAIARWTWPLWMYVSRDGRARVFHALPLVSAQLSSTTEAWRH